jgi:hypothetical protein
MLEFSQLTWTKHAYVCGNLFIGAMDHTGNKTPRLDTFQPIVNGDEWDDVFMLISIIFFFLTTKNIEGFRSWSRLLDKQHELTSSS